MTKDVLLKRKEEISKALEQSALNHQALAVRDNEVDCLLKLIDDAEKLKKCEEKEIVEIIEHINE